MELELSATVQEVVIKEAFKQGFIKDDEIFLDMLEDRNRSSHIYEEKTAEEILKG